jgi:hypothetical protein
LQNHHLKRRVDVSNRTILLIGSESLRCKSPQCFNETRIGDEVLPFNDVTAALDYLRDAGESAGCDGNPPALLVVSSGVGTEALSHLLCSVRNDQRLKHIAVVVLTSAEAPQASVEVEASSMQYFVRVCDTDTLLDVVSKHLPEGSLARSALTGDG